MGHLALGALVTDLEVWPNTVSLQVTKTNTQNRKWGPAQDHQWTQVSLQGSFGNEEARCAEE